MPPPPPGGGVQEVPDHDRQGRAGHPRCAPGVRQLRHAQHPGDQGLADQAPRFHVHFTPTGSSWINQVERWFGPLTAKLIRRGVHTSVTALEKDIRAWIDTWNENPRPFTWTKTADEILTSLADYLAKARTEP